MTSCKVTSLTATCFSQVAKSHHREGSGSLPSNTPSCVSPATVLCRPHRTLQTCVRPSRFAWVSQGGSEIPEHSLRPDFCTPDVVTVQVGLRNAFNPAYRGDMVHAVADKLPSLMAYQQPSPLVIQRVDGSHEVLWSKARLRQGDPAGRCCLR